MEKMTIAYGITIESVSSQKQGELGDSHEDQKQQLQLAIQRTESVIDKKIEIIKDYQLTGSRRVELDVQPLYKVLQEAKTLTPKPTYVFLKSIDRTTRSGALIYAQLKSLYAKEGMQIIDVYGVISNYTINTLQHHGLSYDWSQYNPTYITELLEAERAHSEVRDILTRMIGAEIGYVKLGYSVGPAKMGYMNERIDTPHGRRVLPKPHPEESKWIIRMFELRIQGMRDEEIVAAVNDLGFKSRPIRRHDPRDPKRILGFSGGYKLTLKQLQRYVANPVYAGINTHKWTKGQPLKKMFPGLVSVEMWNKANKGKITILQDGEYIKIIKGKLKPWQMKKDKHNPNFPYKQYVLCPVCLHPNGLYGSAPRNSKGNHLPRYHCQRNHKYWEANEKRFMATIKSFAQRVRFTDKFKMRFHDIMIEEFEKRRGTVMDTSSSIAKRLEEIAIEQKGISDSIKKCSTVTAIRLLEEDIEKLDVERAELLQKQEEKIKEQYGIQTVINYLYYFMDNVEELLLGGNNKVLNAKFFGMIFLEKPTYEELQFRTDTIVAKLNPLFQINEAYKEDESLSVSRLYNTWNPINQLFLELYATFQQQNIEVPHYFTTI